MDKKGAELSVNVVIIAILAILVLVVVAFIFTGGASKFTETVRNILNPVPKGSDVSFAVSECKTKCALAQTLEDPKISSYCTDKIDYAHPTKEEDGAPKLVKDVKCYSDKLLMVQAPCDITCIT